MITFLVVMLNPPSATTLLAEVWQVGGVAGRVLGFLAGYLGLATAPLLVAILVAWLLASHPNLRRRGLENPAELRFGALSTS